MKVHLGCGRNILPGWINIDSVALDGVDIVADLDNCQNAKLPLENDSVDEFLGHHVLEHLHHPLPFMEEIHRIAKPGARAVFRLPYGSSDDALDDPTHVRQYFAYSTAYFSQPAYWRADYGYRGDWQTDKTILLVAKRGREGKGFDELFHEINTLRNVVREMIVELSAVKPIREPKQELQVLPGLEITLV